MGHPFGTLAYGKKNEAGREKFLGTTRRFLVSVLETGEKIKRHHVKAQVKEDLGMNTAEASFQSSKLLQRSGYLPR